MDAQSHISDLRQIIECPICLETFKTPKALYCSHSLCKSCAVEYVRFNPVKDAISCPVCRQVTPLPAPGGEEGAGKLPVSSFVVAVINIVDSSRRGQEPTVSGDSSAGSASCSCRSAEALRFYCDTCVSLVCGACQSSKCSDHSTQELSRVARRLKPEAPSAKKITDVGVPAASATGRSACDRRHPTHPVRDPACQDDGIQSCEAVTTVVPARAALCTAGVAAVASVGGAIERIFYPLHSSTLSLTDVTAAAAEHSTSTAGSDLKSFFDSAIASVVTFVYPGSRKAQDAPTSRFRHHVHSLGRGSSSSSESTAIKDAVMALRGASKQELGAAAELILAEAGRRPEVGRELVLLCHAVIQLLKRSAENEVTAAGSFKAMLTSACHHMLSWLAGCCHRSTAYAQNAGNREAESYETHRPQLSSFVRFVEHLYQEDLLLMGEMVLHDCLAALLSSSAALADGCYAGGADDQDRACSLLAWHGWRLDHTYMTHLMDRHFERIARIRQDESTPGRLRAVLDGLMDLRQRVWMARVQEP